MWARSSGSTVRPETSDSIREVFEVIDPRSVMAAGIDGDPGRAMAGSMAAFLATTACLNDSEWAEAAQMTAMSSRERGDARCHMSALGGPGEMAEAVTAAQEGDLTAMAGAAARAIASGRNGRPGCFPPSNTWEQQG